MFSCTVPLLFNSIHRFRVKRNLVNELVRKKNKTIGITNNNNKKKSLVKKMVACKRYVK